MWHSRAAPYVSCLVILHAGSVDGSFVTDEDIHPREDRPEASRPPSRLRLALAYVAEGGRADVAELRLALREYVLASRNDGVRVERVIVAMKREADAAARRRLRADDFAQLISDIVHWCVDDYYGAPTDSISDLSRTLDPPGSARHVDRR
jgi:hypothetical protein